MSWLPDDIKDASGGEVIDRAARDAVRLAHRALERFPNLVRRHKVIAGGAAISSSLVILAGVAIARRMHKGQTAEEAISAVTETELESGGRRAAEDDEPAPADRANPMAVDPMMAPSPEAEDAAEAEATRKSVVAATVSGNGKAPEV